MSTVAYNRPKYIIYSVLYYLLHDDGLHYVNVDRVDVLPIINLPD